VSGSSLTIDGEVLDWHSLPEDDTYYEGTTNGLPSVNAHLDQAIVALLDHWDPIVDFSQYDDNGADGVPNSVDDDGFVDWIAIVTPETGNECPITLCPFEGNTNIRSHQSTLSRWWPGDSSYVTNDNAFGGGKIRVNRYFVSSGLGCDDLQNGIGTFCHEFGHVLGIADLVDMDLSSEGR
jgi:M6 family metalloprotease-like protein